MKTWHEFIEQNITTDAVCVDLITQYEQMCRDGCIGECLLRSTARLWLLNLSGVEIGIVQVMRDIAMESYKLLAHKYMNSKFIVL